MTIWVVLVRSKNNIRKNRDRREKPSQNHKSREMNVTGRQEHMMK